MIKGRGTYSTIMHPTLEQQALDKTTPPEKLCQLAKQSPELARLVAKNESADSELLQELAFSSDNITREGVATNPNTPTEVLLKLGAEFPRQLLDNPVFSLLLLENPKLVEEIPIALRSSASFKRVSAEALLCSAIFTRVFSSGLSANSSRRIAGVRGFSATPSRTELTGSKARRSRIEQDLRNWHKAIATFST